MKMTRNLKYRQEVHPEDHHEAVHRADHHEAVHPEDHHEAVHRADHHEVARLRGQVGPRHHPDQVVRQEAHHEVHLGVLVAVHLPAGQEAVLQRVQNVALQNE